MTRVCFSKEDLMRVRFTAAPAPLVEVVMGLAALRYQLPRGIASSWAVHAQRAFPVSARPLLDLVHACGPWPTFLDPPVADLEEGLEIVTATPRRDLRDELAATWRGTGRPPTWLRALADGDREAMTTVVRALGDYYAACVAPSWPAIVASFRADVAERAAALVRGGLAEMFDTLSSDLDWRDGALERNVRSLEAPAEDTELLLEGRGMEILPLVTWTGPPLFLFDSSGSAPGFMVYPVPSARYISMAGALTGAGETRGLAALMGRTRAGVLHALRDPCGTAELATRMSISAASASEHVAALREAGLAQTERRGRGVRHSLTPLGRSLLEA